MANTISVMTNAVRGVVSKKRIRYQENGYDLDLAYVTDNLIAMGYPAESIESIFRNKIDHVYHFLEEKHKDHYKIYNLCSERHYDGNKFHGRVALYPFDDHNPPPIRLIKKFCDDVDAWLKADKENVAAVHCKAGKGRTGTMICCYLLHCHMKTTAESALTFYDEKRTKNKKGVTIPSQRRYVEYYAKLVSSGQPYEERTLQILEIRFSPQLSNQDNIYCSIYPNPRSDDAESNNITLNFRKTQTIEINDRCIPLTGDVKIEVFRKVMKRREKYFHFWFNTYFICDNAAVYEDDGSEKKIYYELSKYELDDAHKDTEHKTVPQDFKVQLAFKPVPKYHHTTPTSTTPTIAYVANDSNSLLKVNHSNSTTFGPQQNHHSHYNQLQHSNNVALNHHNAPLPSILPRPNATNNINNISDPTTMTNQRVPNATRLSSVGSSSSRSSSGDQQVHMLMSPSPSQSSAVIVDMNCCYPNQRDHHQQLEKYQSQKHQHNPLQNSTSLTNAIALTKAKDDFSQSNSENRLSNNYKGGALARSNYQEDNIPHIANQQPLKYSVGGSDRDSLSTSTAAAELHTPSVSSDVSRTNSSSRSSSINSSEVSSQSAGCGGDCGDEEEDWESGESSLLSKRKETINDKTGIENENENDHENSMLMAMMDAEDSYSTVHVNNIHSSLVSPSSLHNLSQDSSGNDSNNSFQGNTSILRNDKCRNPNLINLNLKSNSANNNNSCNNNNGNYKTNSRCMDINFENTNASNFMETTSSNSSCSNVSKLMLTEKQQNKVETLAAPAASSTGCSKLTKLANIASKTSKPANKTLGLHNTISNNNNASKKMQKARRWLSSMKSDPDLCETLAKSVNFRKVANHPATSSSGVMIKRAAGTETDTGCNRITDIINNVSEEAGYVSGDNGRGLHYSLLNHRTRTNSTSDHDDFYSSLCDKQLSFGGSSPMKSPLNSIDRIKLRGDTIGEQILRRGKVNDNSLSEGIVVVAKPIQSCAIGFNVPSNNDYSSLPAQENEADKDTVDAPERYDKPMKIELEQQLQEEASNIESNDTKANSTTQQASSAAPPLINSNNLPNPPTKSSSTASFQIAPNSIPVTPSIATLSTICADDPKAFALISSSPPAGKANRCAPFSFRTLRQNLDSVLKSKSTKNANNSS